MSDVVPDHSLTFSPNLVSDKMKNFVIRLMA